MIDKKSIIKMAEHVFHKSQNYPDRRLMHPAREWGLGIFLFVCCLTIGSVIAGQLFVTYKNVGDIEGTSEGLIPRYREVIVQDALEMYRLRNDTYELLQSKHIPSELLKSPVGLTESSVVDAEKEVEIKPIF